MVQGRRVRRLAATLAALFVPLLSGCVSEPTGAMPVVEATAVRDATTATAPSGEGEAPTLEVSGIWRVADTGFRDPLPEPQAPESKPVIAKPQPAAAARPPPRREVVALPKVRERRKKPKPKTASQSAAEHFLRHPTRVKAQKITFYCPTAYRGQVRLRGQEITDPRPGRRVARGRASLTCRELTLEADSITLKVRRDGRGDLQITARGDVLFTSTVGKHITHEKGLRSLLISNDQITPLR